MAVWQSGPRSWPSSAATGLQIGANHIGFVAATGQWRPVGDPSGPFGKVAEALAGDLQGSA
ncbi:MAG: hypothetical protein JWM36_2459 [Hyphomicrobiales bacterium]|nr:hypothetical protein [Hyphomicrobiales bacterium]